MKYTPDSICRALKGIVEIDDCKYMVQCESGTSSKIVKLWKLNNNVWIEQENIDWPNDMTKEPFCFIIRWGSLGKNLIQINVLTKTIRGIYKYDGEIIKEVLAKKLS